MNIKQHIEAGHYPKDEKGRALVPMRNGGTATIYATDHPGPEPIAGYDGCTLETWHANGEFIAGEPCGRLGLLPPPPRKVEVKRWIEHDPAVNYFSSTWESDKPSGGVNPRKGCVIVELTGSYEEPWS